MRIKICITYCFSIICGLAFGQNFYQTTTVRDVKLTFPTEDFDRILDSAKRAGNDARLTGTLVLDGQKFENVGVRYKGNSSYFGTRKRGVRKMPLNVKLTKKQLIENKYETLKLSNINRDASFLREALSYEIIGTYMPAPRACFAKVAVNDKPMGFYNLVESVDKHFLKNHGLDIKNADNTEGSYLIKCDPEFTAEAAPNCPKSDHASLMYLGEDSTCYERIYEMDKGGSWRDFIHFIRVLNQEPTKIESVLNVDQTLWMLALNNALVNLDSYNGLFSHNYYLYRTADGRFSPIMWDLNLSLGGFTSEANSAAPLTLEAMQNYQPLRDVDNPKRPLIAQILKNATYRKIYVAHLRTILNDWLTNGKYFQRAKEIAQVIDNQVNADKNKHYSYDEFKKNLTATVGEKDAKVVGIEELMKPRIAFLQNHALLLKAAPTISTPTAPSVFEEKLSIKIKIENAARAFCCVRNDATQAFRYLPMLDDGKHNDEAAGDGIFGVVVDKKSNFQYYIVAENEDAASVFPERAAFEFLAFKL